MFGLTIDDVRKLAYDIMKALKAHPHIPSRFNQETGMAGYKWYYAFKKRYPELSLRQPESVSLARSKGFNRENVYEFFNLLAKVVDENNLDPHKIYKVDDSGFSTVRKKKRKILARSGKHQVVAI